MLNDQNCCGMWAGIPYLVTVTSKVTCCKQVLFAPPTLAKESPIWPSLNISFIQFDILSKLKAMLLKQSVSLTSATETYELQVANTSAEIHSLMHTNCPTHFSEMLGRILNMADTSGLTHVFKTVGSGLLTSFQNILGIIPNFVHSLFGSLPLIFAIVAGVFIFFLLIRYGKPITNNQSSRHAESTPRKEIAGAHGANTGHSTPMGT